MQVLAYDPRNGPSYVHLSNRACLPQPSAVEVSAAYIDRLSLVVYTLLPRYSLLYTAYNPMF